LQSNRRGFQLHPHELQERNVASEIEKAHYKFFYEPIYKTNQNEEYILLDVLFETHHYPSIQEIPIQSSFLQWELEKLLNVKVPTIEGILGDKLTAFAPNTTGIPYSKNGTSRSMEIMKQLYDIAHLFDSATNIEDIRRSFMAIAEVELKYRNKEAKTPQDVLNDIIQTSLLISSRGTLGQGDFKAIEDGIQKLRSFVFAETIHLDKAITAASKAAYCASLLLNEGKLLEKYNDPQLIKDWAIEVQPENKLNKLKKSNPEAFFYWVKAIGNLG